MIKRGQGWSFDVMIGSLIFIGAFLSFYFFIINTPYSSQEKLDSMQKQAEITANIVLSEGFPENWDLENVARPGILNDNKINQTKLNYLSTIDYDELKILFSSSYNYYITFSEVTLTPIGLAPEDTENLIRLERLTIYNNRPTTIEFIIWE